MSIHGVLRKTLWSALPVMILLAAAPAGFFSPTLADDPLPAAVGRGSTGDVTTPLHAVVSIDALATVGKNATVTCEVSSDLDATGVTAQIELPGNVKVVRGRLGWRGDLTAKGRSSFRVTIQLEAGGDTAIYCRAQRILDEKNSWGDLAALYLSVGSSETHVGFAPGERIHGGAMKSPGTGVVIHVAGASPPGPLSANVEPPPAHAPLVPADRREAPALDDPPLDQKPGAPPQQPGWGNFRPVPLAEGGPEETEQSTAGSELVPQGNLTVTGNWAYFDRNDNYVGAMEFLVELVRGDNYGHLAWCFTDLGGNYSCGPVTNPGGVGVRSILHSWSNYNPNPDTLAVVNPDWGTTNAIGNTFSTQTGVVVFADGTHDIGAWFVFNNDTYERAYWTQRDLNDTWRYILFNGGGGVAGPTTVQWKLSSTDGTYYNPGGNVHLAGVDPLSPLGVVAKHEYGHNIMYNIYGNYMPPNPNCNPHTIQAALSAGCGWTEGWTEFLTSAVNNSPTFYWPSGDSLDLESPTWGTFGWDNGDWPEGRVAGALWDIFDANNDGDDTYADGVFANLWEVSYNANDNTMGDFWNHWIARGHSNVSWGPIMDLYQNTINYRSGPFNDDFTSPWGISSAPFTFNGWNTTGATTQGNDPQTACASTAYPRQSRSVWYVYTPPITGTYNLNSIGSNYDTVLAVWTGPWGGLVSAACDDDSGGSFTSSLNVTLYGGAPYYIEATGYGTNSGGLLNLSLTLLPPPNDNIGAAFSTGLSYADYENTTGATTPLDDPSFACGPFFSGVGSHSVWYTITPYGNGLLSANTYVSGYDTVLAVWAGLPGSPTLVSCNDDASGGLQSEIQNVRLAGGLTYYVEVLGYNSVAAGAMQLNLNYLPDPARLPESFSSGTPLLVSHDLLGDLQLSWGTSCAATDTDYEVYEGAVGGSFASHAPRICSTSGATSIALTPSPGSSYYLVVPANGPYEGSYGARTGGERPQSASFCAPQYVGACSP
jgi:hypothetical protein